MKTKYHFVQLSLLLMGFRLAADGRAEAGNFLSNCLTAGEGKVVFSQTARDASTAM
jgi:hypothetical protein